VETSVRVSISFLLDSYRVRAERIMRSVVRFPAFRCLSSVSPFIRQQSTCRRRGAARQLRILSPSFSRGSIDIIYVLLVEPQRTLSYPAGTTSKPWTSKIVGVGHVFYKSSFNCPSLLHLLHSSGQSTSRTKPFLFKRPHPWDRLHFPLYLRRLFQSRCVFR